ncbi:MAG: hypothetical protein Q9208_007287 [Pyrenodesmia sp. 3 TL-2023]
MVPRSHENILMISSGFTASDEDRQPEAYSFNRMFISVGKITHDMAAFCFSKVSGENAIVKNRCDGSRPTRAYMFMTLPSNGPIEAIYLPYTVFAKGVFLYTTREISDKESQGRRCDHCREVSVSSRQRASIPQRDDIIVLFSEWVVGDVAETMPKAGYAAIDLRDLHHNDIRGDKHPSE